MPNFRSTPAIDRQLAELQEAGYGNRTQVIHAAVARFHYEELGNGAPPRELQVWRHSGGAYYLVVWQGTLRAACGPMPLEKALPIAQERAPEPEQWDGDIVDWVDSEWDAGRMARVDGHAPERYPGRRVELWRHSSGARFAVLCERGRPIMAAGPLTHAEAAGVIAGDAGFNWAAELADRINAEDEQGDEAAYRRVWPEETARE